MTDIMLGKDAERKLASVSLSNSTIQRRIKDLSDDIKCQVVEKIKTTPFGLFAMQIDKSTDISLCAQLMVFAKYVYNDTFKEEFLFCPSLQTTTKAADILEKVSTFFESENLERKNLAGCCTYGAPSMLGCHSINVGMLIHQCWDADPSMLGCHSINVGMPLRLSSFSEEKIANKQGCSLHAA